MNISERTATAMLYAIKSDTLFFSRHTNRVDLEAFSFLYPLADAALIRKMEGAEITLERLDYVTRRRTRAASLRDQVFCAFLGDAPREDFIPYVADFFLQLEDVKWTIIAGIVERLAASCRVRNLGYSRTPASSCSGCSPTSAAPAATARWPRRSCRWSASAQKFGDLQASQITARIAEMAEQFLHEPATEKKKEPVARIRLPGCGPCQNAGTITPPSA